MADIEKLPEGWPLVLVNDDGIRPAGKPDECFYCNRKVGKPHGLDCTVVTKLVKVRYTIEAIIEVPWFWHEGSVEFHRNESSWCMSNVVNDLKADVERREKDPSGPGGQCLCRSGKAEFVEVVDGTPRGKAAEPPEGD